MSCLSCRNRKVKCDGANPVCSACVGSRSELVCDYTTRDVKKVLAKGDACIPCRNRKRRCDGVRNTCGPCQQLQQKRKSGNHGPCIWLQRYETDPGRNDNIGSSTGVGTVTRIKPLKRLAMKDAATTDTEQQFTQFEVLSQSSSSVHSLLPQLRMEDMNNPYIFAVSSVALDDLNMTFRILFLSQRLTYGVYIPLAKYQALLAGDKSGAVIHPFFICFAHLVGCQFYQERAGSQFLLPIQADHLQSCIEAFATMKEKIDPPGYLLACYSLHLLYGCFHAASSSNEFYKRCTKVIRRNNLRFVPKSSQGQVISSQTPEFTEYAHERIALLAQIVASEATIYICGLPGGAGSLDWHFSKFDVPNLYAEVYANGLHTKDVPWDLEDQFKYGLPKIYPILFEICPIVLRVRSMLLAKDTESMLSCFYQDATPSDLWFTTSHVLLSHLTNHLDDLNIKLSEHKVRKDHEGSAALRFAMIMSFTTLGKLSLTLARHPLPPARNKMEFKRGCSQALTRLSEIVNEQEPMEFREMELFLGVYWTRAVSLFRMPWPNNNAHPSPPYDSTTQPTTAIQVDADFEAKVEHLARLNEKFIASRFPISSESLLDRLAAQPVINRPVINPSI